MTLREQEIREAVLCSPAGSPLFHLPYGSRPHLQDLLTIIDELRAELTCDCGLELHPGACKVCDRDE